MDYLRKVVVLFLMLQYFGWNTLAGKISGAEVINFGHRPPTWAPLMQMSANLSDITSIRSFFDFRTLDPEGIIFYGDTKEGKDWFVLLLRDGIPEMQIGKANTLVSVQGGPKLNDGVWYNLELRSEGTFVVLEVNKRPALVVGVESDQTEAVLTGKIRLALGGMLVDKKKLLHQFKPELDACIRTGNWLNLSTPWDTDPDWESRPCFPEIKKGSYFPGTGIAVFNTTDLPGAETEEKGITIEVNGSWQGTLLSLQSPGFEFILSEKKNKDLTMELKEGSESGNTALSFEITKLTLTILEHSLLLDGEVKESESSNHLQGCLEKILIQGQDIDLDQASFKHSSISSHSCPAKALNELT
ncbi:sex hormone-binding globulin isoform X2 [Astyanax mexicanus]|uniref:sex hormone-binding globulin isoform X2 n=1 Tax=Astyanax mexicanus TaxID=7994 RepID=UPI0020CB5DF1|nr:sex hormone-binding globulin isoform X2 [Astyanax mexicanus]